MLEQFCLAGVRVTKRVWMPTIWSVHIRSFYAPRRGSRTVNKTNTRSFGDRRRHHLLAEFLQRLSARNQANAEDETSSQNQKIDVQNQVTLSDDLLFKILILLPADSLFSLQFVCKNWLSLINSSIFIRCHAQQSEFVLICRKLTPAYQGFEKKPKSFFHMINLEDGSNKFMESSVVELVSIQSSYDGLILATAANNRSLILMNPVTRKHAVLPSGTNGYFYVEAFDIVPFSDEAYNVVHLFRDHAGCTGCEILSNRTRKWRRLDEPPRELLSYCRQIPVAVGGSLYWMFTNGLSEHCSVSLSLNLHDGKFVYHDLPITSSLRDRLFDIDGNLGLVTRTEVGLMQVWILTTDSVEEGVNWVRKYSINLSVYTELPNPICCWKNGKGMVVEMGNGVYVQSFERGEMKMIRSRSDDEVCLRRIDDDYVPHKNTFASWEENV